jgi:hypothetical protein
MSLFLLRPHVFGAAGQVTTPDVIVDRVVLDGAAVPVQRLTHDAWLQAPADEASVAACAVMALGGGSLLLPAVVLGDGPIVVARRAWRVSHFMTHAGEVTLNGVPLADLGLPSALITEAAGVAGRGLPRGHLLVRALAGQMRTAELADPKLGRTLAHAVVIEPLAADRWDGGGPKGRYAVGPTRKEVLHFI